jgi:plasmid stabilization system protein ParE
MVIKKSKVVISNKARESLRSYVRHLKEKVSPEMAEHVRSGIINKCKKLKDFSGYSEERYLETEDKRYRSVTQWNYNIIYTVKDDTVRVLNIIHTSQHPDKRKNI